MGWDRATPFIIDLQVGAEDIDGLGHANNAVYVTWLERCAWRHSQRLGLDLVEYRRLDRAMAVVRHEIDYLAAAYEGDELQLATWIVDWDQRLKMTRHFQLKRPSDNATLLRAQTTFVCIELSTGAQAHAGGVHRGLWSGVAGQGKQSGRPACSGFLA
jgi:acyl-CoA thioester hydrolase